MYLKKWLGLFFQISIIIDSYGGFCILVAEMQLFVLLCSCNVKTWYPDCNEPHYDRTSLQPFCMVALSVYLTDNVKLFQLNKEFIIKNVYNARLSKSA